MITKNALKTTERLYEMDSYYTSAVAISSLSLAAMLIGTFNNHFMSAAKRKLFQSLFSLLILLNWAEWYGDFLEDAHAGLRDLHVLVKMAEMCLTPFVPVIAVRIFTSKAALKAARAAAYFNLILQIFSLYTGAVFSVDGMNDYTRGPLYSLYVATFVVGTIAFIVGSMQFNRHYQHANKRFLMAIIALVIFTIALPIVNPSVRLDWTCLSFVMILFYIYYNQLVQQVDSVTGLLSRRSYDLALQNISKEAAIIFFDVDEFKKINDTYGHSYGDECLVALGRELKHVFEKHGYCYRFGGDETCVILRKNPDEAQQLIAKFFDSVHMLQDKDKRIPDVSVGYAFFNPDEESAEDAVRRADEMMYRSKREKKAAVKV